MSLQKLCLGSQTSQGIDFDCLKIENNDSADNINGNHSELILSGGRGSRVQEGQLGRRRGPRTGSASATGTDTES